MYLSEFEPHLTLFPFSLVDATALEAIARMGSAEWILSNVHGFQQWIGLDYVLSVFMSAHLYRHSTFTDFIFPLKFTTSHFCSADYPISSAEHVCKRSYYYFELISY